MRKKRRLSVSSVSSVSSVASILSISSVSSSSPFSSTTSSLSSESELLESDNGQQKPLKRPRIFRDRTNPFDRYDDDYFKRNFHLSKRTVHYVLELIENKLKRYTERNHPLSPINQLLIALRFYVCGSFHIIVNEDYGATKATISRTVHRVTHFLALESQERIKMPLDNVEEKKRNCNNFYKMAKIPNVCGIIGCMHVKIQSPAVELAKYYRNEHGWFSMKAQLICDSNMQICDVKADSPGSVDNNKIFDKSAIKQKFDNRAFGDYYLLGDSQYDCKEYLLTPINQSESIAEKRYNLAHQQTCEIFDRTIKALKERFPCLSQGLKIFIKKIPPVIVVTCFLHNLAIKFDDNIDLNECKFLEIKNFNNLDDSKSNDKIRKFIINSIFTN